MTTTRAARPDITVRLSCDLGQLSFPEDATCPMDLDDAHLMIRRSGGCEDDWLLAYRPFGRTTEGDVQFRLDGSIHELPAGYYDAVIMEGCEPCGLVRLDKTKRPSLNMQRIAAIAFTECPPPGAALPGDGHSTMLDAFVEYTTKLACALTASELTIKVDGDVPDIPASGVELVIRDGIATETVKVTAATSGMLTVTRGTPAKPFPKGACIQFEWTIENIRAVANENCPVPDPDTGSGDDTATGSGDDTTTAILEVGKGLKLETDADGRIVLSLENTGVPAGTYGGLEVDDCGRVVTVDAEFPANALPVLDGCCKEE